PVRPAGRGPYSLDCGLELRLVMRSDDLSPEYRRHPTDVPGRREVTIMTAHLTAAPEAIHCPHMICAAWAGPALWAAVGLGNGRSGDDLREEGNGRPDGCSVSQPLN